MIQRLRRILHRDEYDKEISVGFKKVDPNKLRYTVKAQDIEYVRFFYKQFKTLSEADRKRVLEKPNTGRYKIYRIRNNGSEYIGSTGSSLFFFLRFNMFLAMDKQESIFDRLKDKKMLGAEITLLEIVKPDPGSRSLVNERKRFYSGEKIRRKAEREKRLDIFRIYTALYRDISCGGFGKKEPRYLYRASVGDRVCLFMAHKRIDRLKGSQREEIEKKLKTKNRIEIELLEKTYVHNELEEQILADRFRLVYQPTVDSGFKLKELELISRNMTQEQISSLRRTVFLRVNRLRFSERVPKTGDSNYVYMLRNQATGSGVIKDSNTDAKTMIKQLYDRALAGATNRLSNDLSIYEEKQFEFKVLRRLKEEDDPKTVVSRFQNRYNLSGYAPNMRRIYSIINARKKLTR